LKIFILLSRIPYPLEKGDKLRAYHQIIHLAKSHEIILFCLNDGTEHPEARKKLEKYCKEIHFFKLSSIGIFFNLIKGFYNGLPFQVNYFYHKKAQAAINEVIDKTKPDRIFCQLIRTSEYVKNIKGIKKTLDYMDVFSKGIERRIEQSSIFTRFFFKKEHQLLSRYEHTIFNYFDEKIIISKQDRDFIQHPKKEDIIIIPNGVDVNFFKPRENENKFYDIVFTGNMNYPPNIDAALFLGKKIIPKLIKYKPDVRLLIAGSYPALSILALSSDNIHVSGWVDDIRDCYSAAKIFVAPMKIGTGLQNKLLEAMSMKLPCITTQLANNALNAKPDTEILIADEEDKIIEYILMLLNYPIKAKEIAENGHNFVYRNYLWDKNCKLLEEIITR
jgi:sugar transferase (PEP-CTERM/EpsH1 system associated)